MRTESALKKNKTARSSTPYQQAVRIGVLFTVEDKQKHEAVKEFVHQLERDGKKVEVLEFLPEKKNNHDFKFDFFTIKDVSFWGSLEAANALKFADTPFDYIFYIDRESNPLILHLLALSKSHCRIGKFNNTESRFFELMIEANGSNSDLIEAMYNYTSKLR